MAGGGLADGEGVGAVCAGGGGAEVVPGARRPLTHEGYMASGDGGAVSGEGAGEGEGLIDGGVRVGCGEGEGGGRRGADGYLYRPHRESVILIPIVRCRVHITP